MGAPICLHEDAPTAPIDAAVVTEGQPNSGCGVTAALFHVIDLHTPAFLLPRVQPLLRTYSIHIFIHIRISIYILTGKCVLLTPQRLLAHHCLGNCFFRSTVNFPPITAGSLPSPSVALAPAPDVVWPHHHLQTDPFNPNTQIHYGFPFPR